MSAHLSPALKRFLEPTRHLAVLLIAAVPGSMPRATTVVYLVSVLGLSSFVAGLYTYSSTLLGILVTFYVSRGQVDRTNPVRLYVVTSGFLILSMVFVYYTKNSPLFLVPAVLLFASSQIGTPTLFMYDAAYGPPTTGGSSDLLRTRLLISVAWIIGPPLAFFLFWVGGYFWVVLATALMIVVSSLAMLQRARGGPLATETPKASIPTKSDVAERPVTIGFWTIFSVVVATTATNTLHAISMPLYLIDMKHVPAYWPGLIMSFAAAVEVVSIYVIPRIARKFSDGTVMWGGLVIGVLYFATITIWNDPRVILASQVLYGAHFSLTTVTCLPLLRRISKRGVGSLAAQFTNATKIGGLVGSAAFGLMGGSVGYFLLLVLVCPVLLITGALAGCMALPKRRELEST